MFCTMLNTIGTFASISDLLEFQQTQTYTATLQSYY